MLGVYICNFNTLGDILRIVFFDGYCNLCNGAVSFLIKVDCNKRLKYAPLSGPSAKQYGIEQSSIEGEQTIIYKRDDQIFDRSDAILEICADILPFGKVFLIFKIIPKFIRDSLYKFIAKNRFKMFGKRDTCRLPTPEERALFLD